MNKGYLPFLLYLLLFGCVRKLSDKGCRVKETPKKELSYLQILDWNGNFIAGFRFDKRLFSIAVNEDTKTLYGLAGGDTSHVYVYKLAL